MVHELVFGCTAVKPGHARQGKEVHRIQRCTPKKKVRATTTCSSINNQLIRREKSVVFPLHAERIPSLPPAGCCKEGRLEDPYRLTIERKKEETLHEVRGTSRGEKFRTLKKRRKTGGWDYREIKRDVSTDHREAPSRGDCRIGEGASRQRGIIF